MQVPAFVLSKLQRWASAISMSRPPDVVIGDFYLHRWHVIPRNSFFNIYLHNFLGSDNDVLHDHPWLNVSCLIRGRYTEHTIAAGGVHHQKVFTEGNLKFRKGEYAHRVELFPGETTWTFFITGPKYRSWGFHCRRGWVHWRKFTAPTDGGNNRIGAGCGEYE